MTRNRSASIALRQQPGTRSDSLPLASRLSYLAPGSPLHSIDPPRPARMGGKYQAKHHHQTRPKKYT